MVIMSYSGFNDVLITHYLTLKSAAMREKSSKPPRSASVTSNENDPSCVDIPSNTGISLQCDDSCYAIYPPRCPIAVKSPSSALITTSLPCSDSNEIQTTLNVPKSYAAPLPPFQPKKASASSLPCYERTASPSEAGKSSLCEQLHQLELGASSSSSSFKTSVKYSNTSTEQSTEHSCLHNGTLYELATKKIQSTSFFKVDRVLAFLERAELSTCSHRVVNKLIDLYQAVNCLQSIIEFSCIPNPLNASNLDLDAAMVSFLDACLPQLSVCLESAFQLLLATSNQTFKRLVLSWMNSSDENFGNTAAMAYSDVDTSISEFLNNLSFYEDISAQSRQKAGFWLSTLAAHRTAYLALIGLLIYARDSQIISKDLLCTVSPPSTSQRAAQRCGDMINYMKRLATLPQLQSGFLEVKCQVAIMEPVRIEIRAKMPIMSGACVWEEVAWSTLNSDLSLSKFVYSGKHSSDSKLMELVNQYRLPELLLVRQLLDWKMDDPRFLTLVHWTHANSSLYNLSSHATSNQNNTFESTKLLFRGHTSPHYPLEYFFDIWVKARFCDLIDFDNFLDLLSIAKMNSIPFSTRSVGASNDSFISKSSTPKMQPSCDQICFPQVISLLNVSSDINTVNCIPRIAIEGDQVVARLHACKHIYRGEPLIFRPADLLFYHWCHDCCDKRPHRRF